MHQIDSFIKQGIKGFQKIPSQQANKRFDQMIEAGSRKRGWEQIGIAAVVTLVVLSSAYLVIPRQDSNPPLATQKTLPRVEQENQLESHQPFYSRRPSTGLTPDRTAASEKKTDEGYLELVPKVPGEPLSVLSPLAIKIKCQPLALAAPAIPTSSPNPPVTIIYRRSSTDASSPETEATASNSRLQKWIEKARSFRDGELVLPSVGEMAGALFAKDSEKSEPKITTE